MKRTALMLAIVMQALGLAAAPLRVALLDTEDLTGQKPDPMLGDLQIGAVAQKGATLIGKFIANSKTFDVIDRRDFTSRIERIRSGQQERLPDNATPLQAARALRADAVMKSALLNLSVERRAISQGGYNVELKYLTLRVMVEVLDTTDGAIMGMGEGSAGLDFRMTPNDTTTLGEDALLSLFESAVAKAIPELESAIQKRIEKNAERGHVALTVKTLADPAMVEIDGMLMGTTPLDKADIYAGDHIISITKPGYQTVSKRILVQKDMSLTVPMLRNELTMEEVKEISKDMSLNRIAVMQPAWIMTTNR